MKLEEQLVLDVKSNPRMGDTAGIFVWLVVVDYTKKVLSLDICNKVARQYLHSSKGTHHSGRVKSARGAL